MSVAAGRGWSAGSAVSAAVAGIAAEEGFPPSALRWAAVRGSGAAMGRPLRQGARPDSARSARPPEIFQSFYGVTAYHWGMIP